MEWTITALDVLPDNAAKIVARVHYTVTAQDSGFTASRSSVQVINYEPDQPFTPYNDLTHDLVLKWLQDAMGDTQLAVLTEELAADLARQKNPPVISAPLPIRFA